MDLMSRRRALLSLVQSGGELPSEYAKLPYIFGDGRQRIITSLMTDENDNIVVDCRFVNVGGTQAIFGCRSEIDSEVYNAIYAVNYFNAQIGGRNAYMSAAVAMDTNRHTHVFNIADRKYDIDGIVLDLSSMAYIPANSLYSLFFLNNGTQYAAIVYYGVSIDGKLNLVPCIRKLDGEIGMYDTVNNVFYTNCGEGTFHRTLLYSHPLPEDAFVATSVRDRASTSSMGEITYNNGVFTLTRRNPAAGLSIVMGVMEANETYRISGVFNNIDGNMYIAKATSIIRPDYVSARKATNRLQSGTTDFTPTETGLYEFLVWSNNTNQITAQDISVTKIS